VGGGEEVGEDEVGGDLAKGGVDELQEKRKHWSLG